MRSWFVKACLAVLLLAVIVVLGGCAPTPPPAIVKPLHSASIAISSAPAAPDPDCLIGNWAVTNLQQMMYESYMQSQMAFRLDHIEGQAGYTFDDQGWLTITFDRVTAVLTGEVDGQSMQVEQVIDGSAVARYSLDRTSSRVMLTGFSGEGILIALEINGQRLVEANFPLWRAFASEPEIEAGKPTSLVEYAQVDVDCRGETLILHAFDPLPGPAIFLERSEPPKY